MTVHSPATSAGSPTNRRRWVILLVLAGAQMLVQLDATIINTALPAIKRAFEMSESQSLWVADAYMVIFGGLLLLAGALGDRFGRRKTLIIGMGIFVAASIAVAFSPDANFLIVGRGLQGLGGALVIPQTLSILTAVFPREERSRAIGIWAGAMGFGMAFGPLVGGVLVDLIGWAGVFWVPAPIAGLAMLGMAAVPESRSQMHTKLDIPGAITGTIAMVAIVFAIIEGIQKGWTDSLIVGSFAVAIVAAVLFVIIERRTDQPLLPMAFFKQRDFTGSMVGMFFIMFALMGVMFYMPQFFQLVQGMSAAESGARLMPLALMMMFFAPVAARLLPVLGPRFMLFWAPAVHGAGALLIFSLVLDIDTPYWMIAIGMAFLGMGGAMHMPATTDTAMASVPVDLAGKASAVNNAGRQLGGTLAIAILGSFAAAVYSSGVNSGLGPIGLPEQAVEILSTGIGAAQQVLPTLDPSLLLETQLVLRESFVDAISNTMRFGIIFALISGVVGWILVPKRQRQEQMQWEDGKPVEQDAPVPDPLRDPLGPSPNGTNGTREFTPSARSMALVRPQKSGVP
ncbi:MAG: MFS transporter [Chloroflexi bacterium]|nr:MFS transporter [Chloroflexota bacterium]MYF82090.1 MFS transporter [Chloroflexota bacterium]MYI03732.1 MFS transporter [Chloroflexota bacterium]